MDAALFLLLTPDAEVPVTSRTQQVATWGDIEEAQGPPIYHWGQHCRLIPDALPSGLDRRLPEALRAGITVYRVNDEALDLVEAEVNEFEVDWEGYSLSDLLATALGRTSRWGVLFLWHWDELVHIHKVVVDDAISMLKENLHWKHQRSGQLWWNG
jgi:hypothetical protein